MINDQHTTRQQPTTEQRLTALERRGNGLGVAVVAVIGIIALLLLGGAILLQQRKINALTTQLANAQVPAEVVTEAELPTHLQGYAKSDNVVSAQLWNSIFADPEGDKLSQFNEVARAANKAEADAANALHVWSAITDTIQSELSPITTKADNAWVRAGSAISNANLALLRTGEISMTLDKRTDDLEIQAQVLSQNDQQVRRRLAEVEKATVGVTRTIELRLQGLVTTTFVSVTNDLQQQLDQLRSALAPTGILSSTATIGVVEVAVGQPVQTAVCNEGQRCALVITPLQTGSEAPAAPEGETPPEATRPEGEGQ